MNTRFQVGIAMLCIMLSGEMVLADDPTGNAEQGESVYRTYCLNCHGAKGRGDGPMADSLRHGQPTLASETVQKKTGERIVNDYSRWKAGNLHALLKGRVIRAAQTECPSLSTRAWEIIPRGWRG